MFRRLARNVGNGELGTIFRASAPENDETNTSVLDGSIVAETLEGPGGLESPEPVAASVAVNKHTDRVAVIIEDRPLANLIPILLHFHSVLGPKWPIIFYTTQQTADTLLNSAPLSRAVAFSEIEVRYLPVNTTFDSHASVSVFLTSPFLWTDLAPYLKILLFQADSILCSASPAHVDEFLDYDFIGAPINKQFGTGFNGGLSLRNRELALRVIERWDFGVDSAADDAPTEWKFEDQWFHTRLRELGEDAELVGELGIQVNLPDQETAGRFSGETTWVERQRPLGFHQPHRWQSNHMDDIMQYCPEVGMIAGSSFFG
ncbi:hypothetical protein E0Z10_g995 [Xylaria hypoxylon]|uniref:DUF5672 domain-containing protein n=1 Tax=Xylaria hypoxylon TaxID=37992 RepID=A0A4Z0YUW4_9PEZI|nr:hypothetical protein E0Z10_g995 [Xylaria hypoxylon]